MSIYTCFSTFSFVNMAPNFVNLLRTVVNKLDFHTVSTSAASPNDLKQIRHNIIFRYNKFKHFHSTIEIWPKSVLSATLGLF